MAVIRLAALILLAATGSAHAQSVAEPSTTATEALLDFDRLGRDRVYATSALSGTERGPAGAARDALRAAALAALGQNAESRVAFDGALASGSPDGATYAHLYMAGSLLRDPVRMVRAVEGAASNVPASQRALLHAFLTRERIRGLNGALRGLTLARAGERLSDALVTLDWPAGGSSGAIDYYREEAVRYRMRNNRRGEAEAVARTITTLRYAAPLLLLRRYDGLIPAPDGVPAALQRIMAEQDRRTAAALDARPGHHSAIVDRAEFLRAAGRNQEVIDLTSPFLGDLRATVAASEEGMWMVNEAAYALQALGRGEEALALMQRLTALDHDRFPGLIGPTINYAVMLWQNNRPSDAIALARRIETSRRPRTNAYGGMLLGASAVCSNVALGRTSAAQGILGRMLRLEQVNQGALTMAYLCLDDLDSAERLIIQRLGSEDTEAVLALQDHRRSGPGGTPLDAMRQRLLQLRERPRVRAALERVARVESLPMAHTYWDF